MRKRWTSAVLLAWLCTAWPAGAHQGNSAPALLPSHHVDASASQSRDDAASESEDERSRTTIYALVIGIVLASDILVLFWFLRRRAEASK